VANGATDSKFVYRPAAGLFGSPLDYIEFKVVDELGLTSAAGRVEVHVNPIDNVPVGSDDGITKTHMTSVCLTHKSTKTTPHYDSLSFNILFNTLF
jgi:hypothetical protein